MAGTIGFIDDGTVIAPQGFQAGATFAGLKTYAEDKLDLGLILSETPCVAAGVFTTNAIRSPSVTVCQEHLTHGPVRGLIVNAGIANACVGDQGYDDAVMATSLAAQHLGVQAEEMLICSTGVIGVELPMSLISAGITQIELSRDGGHPLARAMMTTDTRPKETAVSFEADGRRITLGGVCKGSGMIHPAMATMLAFVTTDAAVEPAFLQDSLREIADESFNMLTVDGDSSTNDTLLVMANGMAGNQQIGPDSPDADTFREALRTVCVHLTRELARDGEGRIQAYRCGRGRGQR